MVQDRRALDFTALSLMCCSPRCGDSSRSPSSLAADVSPVMQAAIRSLLTRALLLAWAQVRGIAVNVLFLG
jgi:hypothetical protein